MPTEIKKENRFMKDIWTIHDVPEKKSSEAVDILRAIQEDSVFIGGTDYRVPEKHINRLNQFLNNLTD